MCAALMPLRRTTTVAASTIGGEPHRVGAPAVQVAVVLLDGVGDEAAALRRRVTAGRHDHLHVQRGMRPLQGF